MAASKRTKKEFLEEVHVSHSRMQELRRGKVKDELLAEALKESEEHARIFASYQKAISELREFYVREASFQQMLQKTVDFFVKTFGYYMAWYGELKLDEKVIIPKVWAGKYEKYLDGLRLELDDSKDAKCAMSLAIVTKEPFGYADLEHDKDFEKWRPLALKYGYRSNQAIPLVIDGKSVGAFLVYSTRPRAFSEDLVRYLAGITNELVTIVENITERKKAEEALRRSKKEWESTFNAMSDWVVLMDVKRRILRTNDIGEEFVGVPLDEMVGQTCCKLVHGSDTQLPNCPMLKMLRTSRRETMELQLLDSNRWLRTTVDPVIDEKGIVVSAVHIVSDITERKKAEQERVAAVQERAAVIDAMSDALVVINLEGEIISCNPAHLRMIDHSSANEIVGKHFSELGKSFCDPEAEIPRLLGIFKRIIQDGFSEPVEVRVRRTDGKELTVSASVSLQRDALGNPLNVIAILRDITPQKRLQEMEKEAAVTKMAVETIEGMLAGITIMDLDGTIRQVNSEFERRSGYKREEAVGKKSIDLGIISKEENQRIEEEVIPKLMNEGLVRNVEMVAVSRDGTRFPILMSWRLIKDAQGNPKSIIATATDITERKRAEEELKRSKEYLAKIINALDDPVFVKDEQHRWVVLNDAACKVMGHSREELIGKSDYDLFPKEQADVFWERDNFVLKNGGTDVNEEKITWHGKLHTISTKKSLLTDSLTGKKFIAGTVRDVTERKRWEEKLLEYQEQLRLMASELSLAEERERRRIATELHDRISQDLVLSVFRLDSLRKSVSSGALAAPLGEISNLIEKTIRDTRSLTLDLSSPMLYRFGFERTIADWLVQEVQKRHGIKSEFEDDGCPKPLEEDVCVFLFQATRELLINVVKHAQAQAVKVSVRRKGGEVETIIEDDGVGLDLSEIESVMPSSGKFGLFSIRERLNYMGGNIKIESKPGHGTRVILTAPLKREK